MLSGPAVAPAQVVQLYAELAAGFESMITEDLINSPPERAAADAPSRQAEEAAAAAPAESAQRSDTVSAPQRDGSGSQEPPDPTPEAPLQ